MALSLVLNQSCTVGQSCFSQPWDTRHGCVTSPGNSEAEEQKGSVQEGKKEQQETNRLVVGRGIYTEKLQEWGMVGEILTLSRNDEH